MFCSSRQFPFSSVIFSPEEKKDTKKTSGKAAL
jgi:hypothetical protein